MSQQPQQSALAPLVTPEDYAAQNKHVFRSPTSMEWTLRKEKPGLIEAGALVYLLGRWYLHPVKFDAYMLARGQEAARGQLAA